jgi:hypothetical protein
MMDSDREKKKAISELDVIGRCKQCGAPVTEFNRILGPTGLFCSDLCRQKHEAFTERAQALDVTGKRSSGAVVRHMIRKFLTKVIVLLILLFFIGLVATFFEIPILSDIVEDMGIFQRVKGLIGST